MMVLGGLYGVQWFWLEVARAQTEEAGPATQTGDHAWEMLDRRPGQGEWCVVGDVSVHGPDIAEIRYKGRTFHVTASLVDRFASDPDRYFGELQARSALFDEQTYDEEFGLGWLAFGLYVLVGLIFGAMSGYLALQKARKPFNWFLAGLFGNVFAFSALAFARPGQVDYPSGVPRGFGKIPSTHQPVACDRCGTPNHPAARVCIACGASMTPTVRSESGRDKET